MNALVPIQWQRGQILLLIILVGVIALTVGLSVASRTITNVRTATQAESSQRALAAAEAGIQRALNGATTTNYPLTSNQSLITSATRDQLLGSTIQLNNGSSIPVNQGIDVWLVSHNPDNTLFSSPWSGTNNITINWDKGTCSVLEMILVSGASSNNPTLSHYIANPSCPGASLTSNVAVGGAIDGFDHTLTLSITDGYVLHIVPLYSNTTAEITGANLPSQGKVITSTGASGETQRKIVYYQSYPALPSEFFYGLYNN